MELSSEIAPDEERSRAVLLITLTFWVIHFSVFTLANAAAGDPQLLARAAARFFVSLIGIGVCYGVLHVIRRCRNRSLRFKVILIAPLALVAAEFFSLLSYFAFARATGEAVAFAAIDWNSSLIIFSMYSWFFFAWAIMMISLEYSFDRRNDMQRIAEYKSLAQAAQIRGLHAQFSPHFLFNALNSVLSLILDRRVECAEQMVIRLANFFRLTMEADPFADLSLSREIELQQEYLAIEQIRYPDLAVEIDAPEEVRRLMVPALLLQPLVENAIKHGAARSKGTPRIAIRARAVDGRLSIAVENFGESFASAEKAKGAGRGLSLVRERLTNRYGDDFSFSVGPMKEAGFRAAVGIPMDASHD